MLEEALQKLDKMIEDTKAKKKKALEASPDADHSKMATERKEA